MKLQCKEILTHTSKNYLAILKKLLDMDPVIPSQLPKEMRTKGIYLFSNRSKHLYVGRTNNIKRRIIRTYLNLKF